MHLRWKTAILVKSRWLDVFISSIFLMGYGNPLQFCDDSMGSWMYNNDGDQGVIQSPRSLENNGSLPLKKSCLFIISGLPNYTVLELNLYNTTVHSLLPDNLTVTTAGHCEERLTSNTYLVEGGKAVIELQINTVEHGIRQFNLKWKANILAFSKPDACKDMFDKVGSHCTGIACNSGLPTNLSNIDFCLFNEEEFATENKYEEAVINGSAYLEGYIASTEAFAQRILTGNLHSVKMNLSVIESKENYNPEVILKNLPLTAIGVKFNIVDYDLAFECSTWKDYHDAGLDGFDIPSITIIEYTSIQGDRTFFCTKNKSSDVLLGEPRVDEPWGDSKRFSTFAEDYNNRKIQILGRLPYWSSNISAYSGFFIKYHVIYCHYDSSVYKVSKADYMERFQFEISCLGSQTITEFITKSLNQSASQYSEAKFTRYNDSYSNRFYYCDTDGEWVPNKLPDCLLPTAEHTNRTPGSELDVTGTSLKAVMSVLVVITLSVVISCVVLKLRRQRRSVHSDNVTLTAEASDDKSDAGEGQETVQVHTPLEIYKIGRNAISTHNAASSVVTIDLSAIYSSTSSSSQCTEATSQV